MLTRSSGLTRTGTVRYRLAVIGLPEVCPQHPGRPAPSRSAFVMPDPSQRDTPPHRETPMPNTTPGAQGRPWRRARARCLANADTCALCLQPLDKTLKAPHPMSPSVDHIIPLGMGGPMLDQQNLRATHLRCNQQRGMGRRRRPTDGSDLNTSQTW